MNSTPDQQTVVDDLGDKFLEAFMKSVDTARTNLDEFQEFRPQWFVNFSKRFVANFIHERIWDSMTRRVDGHANVQVVDEEPTRQIHIGSNYVIRFKRHSRNLGISSYPTSGALAFWTNRATAQLPGLELWTLALGYIWEPEAGKIGEAILSFRDSKDKALWSVVLTPGQPGQATGIKWDPVDPKLPQLDLSDVITANEDKTEGS